MARPLLKLTVYGIPMPKGSKTAIRVGDRATMMDAAPSRSKDPVKRREQRLRMKHWPLAIEVAARRRRAPPIDGAVNVAARFYMPRPASRACDVYHTSKPDLDKLLRGTLDPLVSGGALRDDCRVVSFDGSAKLYARAGAPIGHPEGPRVELVITLAETAAPTYRGA